MKTIFTLLLALISFTGISQEMITKEVGEFNEIKVFDLLFVRLIQADENKVVMKGPFSEDIKVINDNGVLKLRMKTDKRFSGEDTYIEVYAKNIDVIDANEGTQIVANEIIKQHKIELRSQEGGYIGVALQVDYAKIKAVTGGTVTASGIAKIQEIQLNTGGIFEGRELKTKDTSIKIIAAGEAEIFATDKADVKITAGGDVVVYGNPKKLKKKKFAGGRIKVVN